MDGKRTATRTVGWVLVALALVLLVIVVRRVGADWSEAIVQGLAALGGAWFWAYRSRPRVTLRLEMRGTTYLAVENVGNRVAKRVQVKSDPPIRLEETLQGDAEGEFGPVEDFGDMDRGQRYAVPVAWVGAEGNFVGLLEATTFEVSHESTWGFRRYKSTVRLGGAGVRRAARDDASTPLSKIAAGVGRIAQKRSR